MKIWNGNNFEYLGYFVKNNKKAKYFEVFDKNGNLLFRQTNLGHACVTSVKHKIEDFHKKYGQEIKNEQ